MNYYVKYCPQRFACKIVMIFNESNKKTEEIASEEKTMNQSANLEAKPSAQKLISCEEVERSIALQLTGNSCRDFQKNRKIWKPHFLGYNLT